MFNIFCYNVVLWFSFVFAPFPELIAECLEQERVSSHNLASRVRAIVYSENDLLSTRFFIQIAKFLDYLFYLFNISLYTVENHQVILIFKVIIKINTNKLLTNNPC